MATFLANEIKVNKYYRESHNGPSNASCPKKNDKKCRVFEDILSGT